MDEVQYAMNQEKLWKKLASTKDRGDYTKPASSDYAAAMKVVRAYQSLIDSIIQYQRNYT